jgi:hypothetical protein
MNKPRTNTKEITDRLRGIKNLRVIDQARRHRKAHATGHQIRLPESIYSRQRETVV